MHVIVCRLCIYIYIYIYIYVCVYISEGWRLCRQPRVDGWMDGLDAWLAGWWLAACCRLDWLAGEARKSLGLTARPPLRKLRCKGTSLGSDPPEMFLAIARQDFK